MVYGIPWLPGCLPSDRLRLAIAGVIVQHLPHRREIQGSPYTVQAGLKVTQSSENFSMAT